MTFTLQTEKAEILYLRSSEWNFENPPANSEHIEAELLRLMTEQGGVGIAANQIGFGYRVFAMNIGDYPTFYYNPEVVSSSEEVDIWQEGCLSFEGLLLKVKRPSTVAVRYQDRNGTVHEEELQGTKARCFQHELDHLDGICFTGRVSKLSLKMAKTRRSKAQRK
jgi:peptide deformylase